MDNSMQQLLAQLLKRLQEIPESSPIDCRCETFTAINQPFTRRCPSGYVYNPYTGECIRVSGSEPVKRGITKQERLSRRAASGWLPSPPDMRDIPANPDDLSAVSNDKVAEVSKRLSDYRHKIRSNGNSDSPPTISDNIRQFCSAIEDQGNIGSCTAQAVVGLAEYFVRRKMNRSFEGSRLFVYKVARRLAGIPGDNGAYIRAAMGAVAICGVPPEAHWPYTDDPHFFDSEPDNFVYSLATNFQALAYVRYDLPFTHGNDKQALLDDLKWALHDEIPIAFGFYGFPSFDEADPSTGEIPFPHGTEQAEWGHAIVAVGYDDDKEITNPVSKETTRGALLIRNSWGTSWGQNGYGWLPYDYVLHGLATDFWSLLDMEWMESRDFT